MEGKRNHSIILKTVLYSQGILGRYSGFRISCRSTFARPLKLTKAAPATVQIPIDYCFILNAVYV
jgi:hypothetical protein